MVWLMSFCVNIGLSQCANISAKALLFVLIVRLCIYRAICRRRCVRTVGGFFVDFCKPWIKCANRLTYKVAFALITQLTQRGGRKHALGDIAGYFNRQIVNVDIFPTLARFCRMCVCRGS